MRNAYDSLVGFCNRNHIIVKEEIRLREIIKDIVSFEVEKIIPNDESIDLAGKKWKKELGNDPYRIFSDKDFMAGVHCVILNLKSILKPK
jgi:intergrase/recombinase